MLQNISPFSVKIKYNFKVYQPFFLNESKGMDYLC